MSWSSFKQTIIIAGIAAIVCISLIGNTAWAYPIDGYELTGIRRLVRVQRILDGKIKSTAPPAGALKRLADVHLLLTDERGRELTSMPTPDPDLQREIDRLFPNRDESYSVALLDVTPGQPPRLAERQSDRSFSPGSVGKLAIAAGLFTELKSLFPDDPEKRRELLKTRMVTADRFIVYDHHEVPVFDPETNTYANRAVRVGDRFSLYEWADHMLSPSANSAASTVWKEALLMRRFGGAYPPTPEQEREFIDTTPKTELGDMAMSVVNDPLRTVGIGPDEWHLGSFFTRTGKTLVPGHGNSRGTPMGLLKFLVAIEQGKLVDEWSSLEIKRLMYMTARRIRYASSPALKAAAVYFKSGSLYRCKQEAGFSCGKYRGNVDNYMNSVAIVEHPDGRAYLVALMSNVLKKNSAVEHQTLATYINRVLSK